MSKNVASLLLLCLGILVATSAGVAAAETVPGASNSPEAGVSVDVPIDDELQGATGTVEVLVSLAESETATEPRELRAHAARSQQSLMAFAESRERVTVERQFWLTNAALVTVDTGHTSLVDLAAVDGVERVAANAQVTIQAGRTGDTSHLGAKTTTTRATGQTALPAGSYDTTYGLEQINATTVWDEYGTRGAGTSVAVLDTGADPDHPDIDVAKWAEFDSDGNQVDTSPNDGNGHGTHVSGTVTGGNASGTHIGVAPEADLYAAKVLGDDGSGTFSQIIAGMEWAVDENADVISMSLGAQGYYSQFIDPVRNAQGAGTTVVASTGNSGEGTSGSPGNVYDAIAVGASDQSANVTSFSSGEQINTTEAWGVAAPLDWPDEYVVPSVAAPGDDVYSAQPGGGYTQLDGTSMAAPHVSGAVALMAAVVTDGATPDEFETALEDAAWKPDYWSEPAGERDTRYGSGIVDVPAAIDSLPTGPNLLLASIDHPATVPPDENLSVNYTVENTGDQSGTESTVALRVDGTGASPDDADSNVTVPAGGTTNGTLTLDSVSDNFGHGDTVSFTVELADSGDSASGTTDVEGDPAEFVVSTLDAADTVAGEALTVTADVENVGDVAATQTVTLDVPDVGSDSTNVTLEAGASSNETLAAGTDAGDAGEYTATVASENDTASANVTVLAPAEFAVQVREAGDIVAGEDLPVTVEVENVGDVGGTQTVTLDVPDLGSDSANVTLEAGASSNETLAVGTDAGDAGEYAAAVTTADDTTTANVTVFANGSFAVTVRNSSDPVAGENLTVTADVENVGQDELTQAVTLAVPGLGNDSTNVTLAGGESTHVTLTVGTGAGDAGEYTATVATADDAANTTVRVRAEASFALPAVDADEPVEGGNLTVTATVENIGDVAATQAVTLDVPGLGSDEQNVTLAGGESTDVTLVIPTVTETAGQYSATVASDDGSIALSVVVSLPALPSFGSPPTDTTGNRLYDDVDGDGTFDIFDVQAFFTHLGSDAIQDHAWAYDFDGDGSVDIFDVQALFDRL